MASAMLAYVIAHVPPTTLAFLGSPDEDGLALVLEDAIHAYSATAALEADCTDTVRFNAIGLAVFWQWAVEYMLAGKFTGGPAQSSSEFTAKLAEVKANRDYYASIVPGGYGPPIICGTVTGEKDPYVHPRYEDQ
jgi:hypothetical protein